MVDATEPPGSLSTMGKLWEGFKHVASKALKWAATAAVVGGIIGLVLAGPVALITGGAGSVLGSTVMGFLNTVSFGIIPASGTGVLMTGLLSGLGVGALMGGTLGAAKGLGGATDAANEAEDRSIANLQRAQTREMQVAAMDQQYMQKQLALAERAQQLGGQSLPGMGPGMGRGA